MPNEPPLRRGDLVVAVFGREHGKPRPAVVVQADLFNASHTSLVLCPISSAQTGLGIFRLKLAAAETPGLRRDSEIMVDKLGAVERRRIGQRIGSLSNTQMQAVNTALRIWLDLADATS